MFLSASLPSEAYNDFGSEWMIIYESFQRSLPAYCNSDNLTVTSVGELLSKTDEKKGEEGRKVRKVTKRNMIAKLHYI